MIHPAPGAAAQGSEVAAPVVEAFVGGVDRPVGVSVRARPEIGIPDSTEAFGGRFARPLPAEGGSVAHEALASEFDGVAHGALRRPLGLPALVVRLTDRASVRAVREFESRGVGGGAGAALIRQDGRPVDVVDGPIDALAQRVEHVVVRIGRVDACLRVECVTRPRDGGAGGGRDVVRAPHVLAVVARVAHVADVVRFVAARLFQLHGEILARPYVLGPGLVARGTKAGLGPTSRHGAVPRINGRSGRVPRTHVLVVVRRHRPRAVTIQHLVHVQVHVLGERLQKRRHSGFRYLQHSFFIR